MATGSIRARRIVFLDFDATCADHGVVPAGHVAAVRAADLLARHLRSSGQHATSWTRCGWRTT